MTKEHAGIEMDLAFGSVKPYGSSRSIVRRIATSLPLKPCTRVHFQLHPYTEADGRLNSSAEQNGFVPSLADVAWIERGAGDTPARFRLGAEEEPGFIFRSHQRPPFRPLKRQRSLPSLHQEARERALPSLQQGELEPQAPACVNQEAIHKISALENELAKLRAQIAQIVLAQEKNAQPAAAPPAPPGGAPPPPPPPPPPLPPPPPPGLHRSMSAIDLIRERRGQKTSGEATLDPGPKQPEIPSMLDVLKDMTKVKLRSVKSRQVDGSAKPIEPVDAASLIAEALKRKFAHRHRSESWSESWSESDISHPVPHESPPNTPMFGQHMLKSTGKKKLF